MFISLSVFVFDKAKMAGTATGFNDQPYRLAEATGQPGEKGTELCRAAVEQPPDHRGNYGFSKGSKAIDRSSASRTTLSDRVSIGELSATLSPVPC